MKCKKIEKMLKVCMECVTLCTVVVTDGRMEIFEQTTITTFLLSLQNCILFDILNLSSIFD